MDYVNLADLDIPTPPGYSNRRDDLNIPIYFAPGCPIPVEFERLRYTNVLPIITDRQDEYWIQAMDRTTKAFFCWNAVSGRVFRVTEGWSLKEVMNMVGISVLNISMTLVTEM